MDKGTTWLLRAVLVGVIAYFMWSGFERWVSSVLTLQGQVQQTRQELTKCQADKGGK